MKIKGFLQRWMSRKGQETGQQADKRIQVRVIGRLCNTIGRKLYLIQGRKWMFCFWLCLFWPCLVLALPGFGLAWFWPCLVLALPGPESWAVTRSLKKALKRIEKPVSLIFMPARKCGTQPDQGMNFL